MNMYSIAETFVKNVVYRYPSSSNFTFSNVVHDMHGDHTGFPEIISSVCRKFASKETVLEHGSGKKMIMYVKDKGSYGRTNRPTNLYAFKEVT
jgi:hypothetical protein